MTTRQQLPGIDAGPPPAVLSATSLWFHGGPGARDGVWLQRDGTWRYWPYSEIGQAANEAAGPARIYRPWFTPTRCRDALDELQAVGSWVDWALGATPPAEVDAWEAGVLVPTRHQIRRLMWLTNRPVGWFCPPGGAAALTYAFACIRGRPGKGATLIEIPRGPAVTGWTGPGWDYRVISLFGPEPDRELRITWGPIRLHLEAQYWAAVALVGSLNEVDPDGRYTLQRAAPQAWDSIPAPAEVEEAADAPT